MRMPGRMSSQPEARVIKTRLRLACRDIGNEIVTQLVVWLGAIVFTVLTPLRICFDIFLFLRMIVVSTIGLTLLTCMSAFLSYRAGGISRRRMRRVFGVIRITDAFRRNESMRWRTSLRALAANVLRDDPILRKSLQPQFSDVLP